MEMDPNYNLECGICGNKVQQPMVPVHGDKCFAFSMSIVYCDGPSEARHPAVEMAMLENHPKTRARTASVRI